MTAATSRGSASHGRSPPNRFSLSTCDKSDRATRGSTDEIRGSMSAMLPGMSRAHKLVNLFAVVLPFAAFLAAVITLWNRYVTWSHLAILVGMYLVTALGITVG